jgi:hypothetical protein
MPVENRRALFDTTSCDITNLLLLILYIDKTEFDLATMSEQFTYQLLFLNDFLHKQQQAMICGRTIPLGISRTYVICRFLAAIFCQFTQFLHSPKKAVR